MARNSYWQKRKQQRIAWSKKANAAKKLKRLRSREGDPEWRLVRAIWLAVYAAPDGRAVELHVVSERGQWRRCGAERAVRGALAQLIWSLCGRQCHSKHRMPYKRVSIELAVKTGATDDRPFADVRR